MLLAITIASKLGLQHWEANMKKIATMTNSHKSHIIVIDQPAKIFTPKYKYQKLENDCMSTFQNRRIKLEIVSEI